MDLLEMDVVHRDDARAMDPIAPTKGELTIAEVVGATRLSPRRGGSLRGAYHAGLTLQTDRASARANDFYVWTSTLPRTYDTARSQPALWPLLAYIKVLIDRHDGTHTSSSMRHRTYPCFNGRPWFISTLELGRWLAT